MSISFSHLLVHTISLFLYVVHIHKITRKWDIKYTNDMSLLDYLLYFGYPRVKFYIHIYTRVKLHTHTLTPRVRHPRVKFPSLPRLGGAEVGRRGQSQLRWSCVGSQLGTKIRGAELGVTMSGAELSATSTPARSHTLDGSPGLGVVGYGADTC